MKALAFLVWLKRQFKTKTLDKPAEVWIKQTWQNGGYQFHEAKGQYVDENNDLIIEIEADELVLPSNTEKSKT